MLKKYSNFEVNKLNKMPTKETISEFEEEVAMPNNNMPLAIASLVVGTLGTSCLGLVLGGMAIYFSNNVKLHFANNNWVEAQRSAKISKTIAIITLILGVVGIISIVSNWESVMKMTGYE